MVISCSYFAGLIFSCMSRKLKDMIMYSISTTTPNLLMLNGQGSWKGQGPLWPITYPWCGDYILRLYQMLMQTWPWWMVFTLDVLSVHFLFHFMKDVEFTYKGISNQFAVVLWIFTYFFSEFPNRTLSLHVKVFWCKPMSCWGWLSPCLGCVQSATVNFQVWHI